MPLSIRRYRVSSKHCSRSPIVGVVTAVAILWLWCSRSRDPSTPRRARCFPLPLPGYRLRSPHLQLPTTLSHPTTHNTPKRDREMTTGSLFAREVFIPAPVKCLLGPVALRLRTRLGGPSQMESHVRACARLWWTSPLRRSGKGGTDVDGHFRSYLYTMGEARPEERHVASLAPPLARHRQRSRQAVGAPDAADRAAAPGRRDGAGPRRRPQPSIPHRRAPRLGEGDAAPLY
jgi:hypothetical protein